jgi:hypothetical protein
MATATQDPLSAALGNQSPPVAPAPPAPTPVPQTPDLFPIAQPTASTLAGMVSGIDLEAILDGVRMALHFGPGTDPMAIKQALHQADPNVQTHSQFWSKGGGAKDTKQATCIQISLRVTTSGPFVDLTSLGTDGEAYAVRVSKKKAETFSADLRAVGRLAELNIAKVEQAIDAKAGVPVLVILTPAEQFGVTFWSTDDGSHFLDAMTPEPPAPEPTKEQPPATAAATT